MTAVMIYIGKYFWVVSVACFMLWLYYVTTKRCLRKFYDAEIKQAIKNVNKNIPMDSYYITKAECANTEFHAWLIGHIGALVVASLMFYCWCVNHGL